MGEEYKFMKALTAQTIRELVKVANELGIRRDDIVSLVREGGQFVLIYY